MLSLRVIRTSSRESPDLLTARLVDLAAMGWAVRYDELPPDPDWSYAAAAAPQRAAALMAGLTETGTDAVLCARGGYGASDLLPLLDWNALKAVMAPKPLVGFSDVSALHCALYARFGWPGLHAPMPATVLWRQGGESSDIAALSRHLVDIRQQGETTGSLPLLAIPPTSPSPRTISGRLFGGCFSVLTNLVGTPHFPRSLAGHILFVEDTDESPPRLMRALNQWLQADLLVGVKALILGNFRRLGDRVEDNAAFVLSEWAKRTGLPTYHTPQVGHTCPNVPLMIGADALIVDSKLTWHWRRGDRRGPIGGSLLA